MLPLFPVSHVDVTKPYEFIGFGVHIFDSGPNNGPKPEPANTVPKPAQNLPKTQNLRLRANLSAVVADINGFSGLR